MFRPKLLFTSLAALALGACAPADPQAVTSAAIARQVILPTYSRWVDADRQLAVSAQAFCQGKSDLDTARADVRTVDATLGRYFDPETRAFRQVREGLQRLQEELRDVELPRPDESLAALGVAAMTAGGGR